jgi:hypothetical protein
MGQILYGSTTTTEAVRRAMQNSQESLRALARQYAACSPAGGVTKAVIHLSGPSRPLNQTEPILFHFEKNSKFLSLRFSWYKFC